jgi:serine/threonine protein kinase
MMTLSLPPESKTPFQLGKRIAMGGMAEVFLAVQKGVGGFEKLVVVKRMLPHLAEDGHFVQMFIDEARLASKLRHPNIVSILDIRRDDEVFAVAMEYLQGEDLRRLVRAQRDGTFRIPIPITLHIIAKLADALHYAHNAKDGTGRPLNLVHRDVAPSNVIVTYDGQVKLIDFGVAKASAHSTYTTPGTIKGKFPYSSPEQVRGKALDARSDVFSLGILLHEMLTGRRLFKGGSTAATLRAVLSDPIPKPSEHNPDVTDAIDEVVMAALERNVEGRTKSAGLVRQQLAKVLADMMANVTSKDLAQWMRTTFARNLEARIVMEKEAIAIARNQPRPSSSSNPPTSVPPLESGMRRQSSHPDSSSSGGSRPSIGSGRSSPLYHRESLPGSRAANWRMPVLVLVLVLVLVALVVAAFTAGRAAANTPSSLSTDTPTVEAEPWV